MSKPYGYIILRNMKYRIGSPQKHGVTKWEDFETGFKPDYSTRKFYLQLGQAEDAVKNFKKHSPEDTFEIKPLYEKP